jgi:hypothetical protein
MAPAQAQAKGPINLLQFGDYQAATGSWPEQLDGAQLGAKAILLRFTGTEFQVVTGFFDPYDV